jgi:membrane protein implicated in regulation of membrane protease activity
MDAFLAAITTYPGFLPSVLIGVLLVFWLLAIIGLVDAEHFGPHFDADPTLHGVDADAGGEVHGGMLVALGLHRLPFSVIVSTIGFFWWLLSVLGVQYLLPWVPGPVWLSGSLLLLVALVAAVPLAAFCVRPLQPLFKVHTAAREYDLIGRVCTIVTGSVDERFGHAEVAIGSGTPVQIKVVCATPNPLRRGSRALILEHDTDRDRYRIEPYDGP